MAKFKVGDRVLLEGKSAVINEVAKTDPPSYGVNVDDEEGIRGCVPEADLVGAEEPEEPAKSRSRHRKKE